MKKINNVLYIICALYSQELYSMTALKKKQIELSEILNRALKEVGPKPQIEDILKQAEVLQELKGKQAQKEKAKTAQPGGTAASGFTQSESYFRAMFYGYDQYALDTYLDSLLYYAHVDDEGKKQSLKPILISMLDNENAHSSDYVFYHAYRKELGIIFDIYTELYNLLNISAGSDQMIIMRDIMKPRAYKYTNTQEFLDFWPTTQFYKDQITARKKWPEDAYLGGWNDSKDPLRSLVLSANISLFGNAADYLASSLYYFVHSESFTHTSDILARFLKIWGFKDTYLQELTALESSISHGDTGHMLQIFIPREQVDKLVYISGIFGLPYPHKITNTFNQNKKHHTDTLSILDLYKTNPSQLENEESKNVYQKFLAWKAAPHPAYENVERTPKKEITIAESEEYLEGLKLLYKKSNPPKNDKPKKKAQENSNASGQKENETPAETQGFSQEVEDFHYMPNFIDAPFKIAMDEIQARIVLLPELFDPKNKIKIYRYSTTPEGNLSEYKKKIKTIVRNMLVDWLNDPKNKEHLKKLNTPLIRLIDAIKSGT